MSEKRISVRLPVTTENDYLPKRRKKLALIEIRFKLNE
jgi:hypothetical protein